MRPERLARWLLCPVASVAAHWCLLVSPEPLLAFLPRLEVNSSAATSSAAGARREEDMTPQDVMDTFLKELDDRRTSYDRVGSAILVAAMWIVLVGLVVPPLLFCCGPLASRALVACRGLWRQALWPVAKQLHRWGVYEAFAYVVALLLSAQGCRHPAGPSRTREMLSLIGGLGFLPCWAYSTVLHREAGDESWSLLLLQAATLGGPLQALDLAPLAVVHESPLVGFFAVAALYGSLAALLRRSGGERSAGGFDPGSGVHCCAASSLLLLVGAFLLRALGRSAELLPFTLGLAVFGHAGYLAAVLVLASLWRSSWETYFARQALAVLSLAGTFVGGWLLASPALTRAFYTFALLFVLEKELESKFDHTGVKVLAAYLALQYLYSNRQHLAEMLDPTHLFA